MANIIDYAGSNKRKLTEDGFNELDGLVLSQLSYINWEEIENLSDSDLAEFGIDSEQLREAYRVGGAGLPLSQMIALIMKTDYYNVLGEKDRQLLQSLVGNTRYADMVVSNYFHRNIPKSEGEKTGKVEDIEQFAALTFSFDNKDSGERQNFVAYRGTDNTLEGWNEDFLMAFETETKAQRESVDYLNKVAGYLDGDIRMGGHSKGGNEAFYSFLFCDEAVRNRIVKLYSYDGPGLSPDVSYNGKKYNAEDYRTMVKLLDGTAFAPHDSLVGQLLDEVPYKFVDTSVRFPSDHDAYAWELDDTDSLENIDSFKKVDQSEVSKIMNDICDQWIRNLPVDQRKIFINIVWEWIYSLDPPSMKETGEIIAKSKTAAIGQMFLIIGSLPDDQKEDFAKAFSELLYLTADNILVHKIENYENVKEVIIRHLKEQGIDSIESFDRYLQDNPQKKAYTLFAGIVSDPKLIASIMAYLAEIRISDVVAYIIVTCSTFVSEIYHSPFVQKHYELVIAAILAGDLLIETIEKKIPVLIEPVKKKIRDAVVTVETIREIVEAVKMGIRIYYNVLVTKSFELAVNIVEAAGSYMEEIKEVAVDMGTFVLNSLEAVVFIQSPLIYVLVRTILNIRQQPVRINMHTLQNAVERMDDLALRVKIIDGRLDTLYRKLCQNNIEQKEGIFTSLANLYHLASADVNVDQGKDIERKASALRNLFDEYDKTEKWVLGQIG